MVRCSQTHTDATHECMPIVDHSVSMSTGFIHFIISLGAAGLLEYHRRSTNAFEPARSCSK